MSILEIGLYQIRLYEIYVQRILQVASLALCILVWSWEMTTTKK
jgi:hypothetical protein